jgi:putative ABC transport system permease protein
VNAARSFTEVRARGEHWALLLRLALRDLRGGLRGFYVFIGCIAIGVMAIAGVGSFARGLGEGLAREGRVIVGGDLAFSLIHREANRDERAFLESAGEVSVVATMRAMARGSDGRSALVEIKAVDAAYPLYGRVETRPSESLASLLSPRENVFGVVADPMLFTRLGVQPGARVIVGNATLELRAELTHEPDRLAAGLALGPRLLMSNQALRATGLIQPGSLVRWHYRIRLAPGTASEHSISKVVDDAARRFPEAGWEVRTRTNASPQLERNVEQFTQYLTLVGLTALLVGGIGVANSAKHYLDRKRNVIAVMKALGATGISVFFLYFAEVLLLALAGIVIGIGAGAALPFVAAGIFGSVIPLPFAPALYSGELMIALAYGVLTAVAFSLWPLGRAHDVPVSALFRDQVAPESAIPRWGYLVATALVVIALVALAIVAAYDRKIAIVFVACAAGVLLVLRLVATLLMAMARKLPRARSTGLRLAIANIHRPGALTPTVVLSLGLGLALLVTVLEIDGNLRRQFTAELPQMAPSFYFLDIQANEAEEFDALIRKYAAGAKLERVPMLRGRIVSVNGVKVEDIKPRPDTAWVLQSDRGITFSGQIPEGSRVVDGTWWHDASEGPPLVSFEKKIADGLGLKVGDDITVNVLGRNVTARIANLRRLDWQSLGINFIMVFSPGSFRGAPSSDIATLSYPDGGNAAEEAVLLKAVADAFPTVTAVRVKDALEAFGALVANLVLAVRVASTLTLVTAVLVLGGALAAGHRHRVYDAVVLKTLGATRRQLIMAYAIEYTLLGLATAVFGVAAGSVAGWGIVSKLMTLPFLWLKVPAVMAALAAIAVTLTFGLWGTFLALGRKPAAILRNL